MKPGQMRERLIPYRKTIAKTATGSQCDAYVALPQVWASLLSERNEAHIEAGELFADMHSEFAVRWAVDIREKWRVKHLDTGTLYTVTSIRPVRHLGMKILKCEKVND